VAEVEAQTQQFRLTGPYGRLMQDAQPKTGAGGPTWSTVTYAAGEMLTPTWEELTAHPDRFEQWPPPGTVLEGDRPAEEPPDETHRARSHR
jgi:hypothetical protein